MNAKLAILIAGVMCLFLTGLVLAEAPALVVNGQVIHTDPGIVVENGTSYGPLRAVAEAVVGGGGVARGPADGGNLPGAEMRAHQRQRGDHAGGPLAAAPPQAGGEARRHGELGRLTAASASRHILGRVRAATP